MSLFQILYCFPDPGAAGLNSDSTHSPTGFRSPYVLFGNQHRCGQQQSRSVLHWIFGQ